MANNSTIAHRFANKLEGKNGRISAGNVRYEGRNYYSYNTVFGQWADVEKNVVVIFVGSTTPSSSNHKLGKWCFPDDVHVFPYNDNRGGWYSYDGCDLMGWEREFTFKHRCILIDYYVTKIYNSLAAINGGKKKGLENVSFEAWGYIEELCRLYKDTTINKWCKQKSPVSKITKEDRGKVKLAKLLKDGERNVQVLTDALFGEGTFKAYYDYCARFRKSADKRAKVEALCNRLGIKSPYEKWCGYNVLGHNMSADDIRKLSAKERLDIHFRALAYKEYNAHESERDAKYERNRLNAYKWIVGCEPTFSARWDGDKEYRDDVFSCRNMFTGQVYDLQYGGSREYYWLDTDVHFYYDKFRKADNKEEWIREFYAKCQEVQDNVNGLKILKRVGAHTHEKVRSWDDDRYIDDEFLRENTTEEEYALAKAFIDKCEKHLADEEARRRAAEIARRQREEEERKEKELQERIKQEQIDECIARGIDGCRDLWRKHYKDIRQAKLGYNDNEFFYGGNVLLRFGINKDKIESSKDIRVTIPTCKAMWKMVSKWHEHPDTFKEMTIKTLDGTYTISSYRNDILTAGCHDIAYAEMERMYNEIVKLENNAA